MKISSTISLLWIVIMALFINENQCFSRDVQLRPDYTTAEQYEDEIDKYIEEGQFEEAAPLLQEALKRFPDHLGLKLSESWLEDERQAVSRQPQIESDTSQLLRPNFTRPQEYEREVDSYLRERNIQEARPLLKEGRARFPEYLGLRLSESWLDSIRFQQTLGSLPEDTTEDHSDARADDHERTRREIEAINAEVKAKILELRWTEAEQDISEALQRYPNAAPIRASRSDLALFRFLSKVVIAGSLVIGLTAALWLAAIAYYGVLRVNKYMAASIYITGYYFIFAVVILPFLFPAAQALDLKDREHDGQAAFADGHEADDVDGAISSKGKKQNIDTASSSSLADVNNASKVESPVDRRPTDTEGLARSDARTTDSAAVGGRPDSSTKVRNDVIAGPSTWRDSPLGVWTKRLVDLLERSPGFLKLFVGIMASAFGSLGGAISCSFKLASIEKKDLKARIYFREFFFRPLNGGFLAVVLFLAIGTLPGFFGDLISLENGGSRAIFSVVFLGALTGLFAKEALEKMREVAETIFRSSRNSSST